MFNRPKDLSKDPMDAFVVQEGQTVLIDGYLFKVEYPVQSGAVGCVWKDHIYFTQINPDDGKNVVRATTDDSDYDCIHARLYMPDKPKHGHAIASRLDWSDALNNKQGQRPCWEQFISYEIR